MKLFQNMKTVHKIMVLVILFPVCLYTVFGAKKGFIQPSDVQNMQQKEQGNFFGETKDCNDLPWWRRWWCKHKDDNVDKPPVPPVVSTSTPGSGPARVTIRGNKLYDPSNKEIILQGFNWSTYREGGLHTSEEDPATILAMKANVVRVPLRWYWGEGDTAGQSDQESRMTEAPGHINPEMLALLDRHIKWATDQKLWVILFIGSDPIWNDQAFLKEYSEVWEFLANRYKDTPYIAAYEILAEPHPKSPYTQEDVKNFYRTNIAAIRKYDTRTPTMIGAAKAVGCDTGTYDVRCLNAIYMGDISNMIYTFNFYEPPQYVKGDRRGGGPYPGTFYNEGTKSNFYADKNYLASLIKYGTDFSTSRQVPVFVNQIGVTMASAGSDQYTTDALSLLTQNGIGFTWWLFRQPDDKHSLHEGGRGALWEEKTGKTGVWHRNEKLIGLLEQFFGKTPQDIK